MFQPVCFHDINYSISLKNYFLDKKMYVNIDNELIGLYLQKMYSVLKIDNLHIKCPQAIKKDIRTNLTKKVHKKNNVSLILKNTVHNFKKWDLPKFQMAM